MPRHRGETDTRAGGTSRRVLLHGGAALGAGLLGLGPALASCRSTAEPEPPSPDEVALREAIAGKESLVQRYLVLRGDEPDLAETLDPVVADHRAHLAELRLRLPGRGTASPTPGGTATPAGATPAPTGSPAARPPTLDSMRAAEAAAAAHRVRGLANLSPPVAQLLTSIGACETAHAALLSEAR